MAVIVNYPPRNAEDVWQVARWAFVWLLQEAMVKSHDESTRAVFERAIALDGLHLHLLEPDAAETARRILLGVARRGAAGDLPQVEVEGRTLDQDSQKQFRAAASDLVKLLRSGQAR